eukprot:scaffold305662_cov33-Tisochrysis_lutea.AAC.1
MAASRSVSSASSASLSPARRACSRSFASASLARLAALRRAILRVRAVPGSTGRSAHCSSQPAFASSRSALRALMSSRKSVRMRLACLSCFRRSSCSPLSSGS